MRLKKIGKKGVLEQVTGTVISVAVIVVTLVVVFLVMASVRTSIGTTQGINVTNSTLCQTSAACNATTTLQNALTNNVVVFVGLILLVTIAGILIFLVRRGLGGR